MQHGSEVYLSISHNVAVIGIGGSEPHGAKIHQDSCVIGNGASRSLTVESASSVMTGRLGMRRCQ